MKKYALVILLILLALTLLFLLNRKTCPLSQAFSLKPESQAGKKEPIPDLNQALDYLRVRKDKKAGAIFAKILEGEPANLDALWGQAEVLRRQHRDEESGAVFKQVLERDPHHIPSLIGLSYGHYKQGKSDEALKTIKEVLKSKGLKEQDEAMAYMVLGAVNSALAKKGFFSKIKYGIRIKGNFLKAVSLAPQMPEVHLALGTFYLFAPAIVGGNLNEAIKELETAVQLAPDFATACGRLAQAYAVKGDLLKYNFYLERAKKLDPENEALKEIR